MEKFEKLIANLNRILLFIGGAFLVGMIVLTCANIFLRLVWVPIAGTYELMGFFGAMVGALALGWTQIKKGHIAVDVLIDTFSQGLRRWLNLINALACGAFIFLCAWQIWEKALVLKKTGEVTETLRVIYYPFTMAMALACAVLGLVFLKDFIKALTTKKEDRT